MTRVRFTLFVLSLMSVTAGAQAQSEMEVFSEAGDAFTLYVNQMPMNEAPAPRVLATLDPGFYQVRIAFADPGKADVIKNNFGTEQGMRTTGKITLNKKGAYVIRPFAHVPMSAAIPPPPPPTMPAATHVPDAGGIYMNAAVSEGMPNNGSTEQVNVSMNVGGGLVPGGFNMNVQMSATETWSESSMTTTTTSSGSAWDQDMQANASMGSADPVGMTELDFQDYLRAIKAKDFEDSKQSTANAPLNAGAMLSASQIAQVMRAFDYESTRVEFAIFAYQRCVDPHNYYKTHGAFEYELSIDELNDAIGQ
jgi:hypothetical protein